MNVELAPGIWGVDKLSKQHPQQHRQRQQRKEQNQHQRWPRECKDKTSFHDHCATVQQMPVAAQVTSSADWIARASFDLPPQSLPFVPPHRRLQSAPSREWSQSFQHRAPACDWNCSTTFDGSWECQQDHGNNSGKVPCPERQTGFSNQEGPASDFSLGSQLRWQKQQQQQQHRQQGQCEQVKPPQRVDSAGRHNGLKPGDAVLIQGLQKQPLLNGKTAMAVRYVESSNRWRILMDEDASKKELRPCNLVPLGSAAPPACAAPLASLPVPADEPADYCGSVSNTDQLPSARTANSPWQRTTGRLRRTAHQRLDSTMNTTGNDESEVHMHFFQHADHCKVRLLMGSGRIFEQIEENACRTTRLKTEKAETDTAEQDSPIANKTLPMSVQQAASNFAEAARQLMAVSSAGGHIEPGTLVRVKGLQAKAQFNNQLGTVIKWDAAQERWNVRLDSGRPVNLRLQNLELCNFSVVVDCNTTHWLDRE
mmetsp:Transcript_135011/g.262915  ORF Transcript_135011/g.262915 Transcript_135011/m.262915 type:complete len:482 (-) Transcript_135011:263-1708(-)